MSLYAIADLHITYKINREAFEKLSPKPGDGLILAGDGRLTRPRTTDKFDPDQITVGEHIEHLHEVFSIATKRFSKVFWVPGNHELYSSFHSQEQEMHLKGESKYMACVVAAKQYGVITPEDEFVTWEYTSITGQPEKALVCPIFCLYDYSFRPAHVTREKAIDWALEEGINATDEHLLHPDPYSSRDEWCARLVQQAENKLTAAQKTGLPLVIVNHWPLREDTVFIPRVPRFSLWCGTKKTEDWHTRFNAKVVVTGHLHVRRTDWIDSVRFEEVSLGYPKQWQEARDAGNDINSMLREILPGPLTPEPGTEPKTNWRRLGWGWD